MALLIKNRKAVLLLLLAAILLITAGYIAWRHYSHPPQPVTAESQALAETPAGVQQAAENAGIGLTQGQQAEIAKQIHEIAVDKREPDTVVHTTGAHLQNAVQTALTASGADFAIVTDTQHSDQVPAVTSGSGSEPAVGSGGTNTGDTSKVTPAAGQPVIRENTPVVLNQYNVKAYPDHMAEATYYNSSNYDVAYLSRIKIFGATGYIGPSAQRVDGGTRIGVRVSIPL